MKYVFLTLLALFQSILLYGMFGSIATQSTVIVDLTVITAWLIVWMFNLKLGVYWAFIAGTIMDVVGFNIVGTTILKLIIVVYVVHILKDNYLSISSKIHSAISLITVCVISLVFDQLIRGYVSVMPVLISSSYNTLIGYLLYYLLANRFKFFQKWSGNRI